MGKVKAGSLAVMALLYIAAGVNHFLKPGFYVSIMPPYLPAPLFLVYLSGLCEMGLGALLFVPRARPWAAWGIIAMLIAFMPVHLHMVVAHEDSFADVPFWALVARIPLQALLILWAWWFTRNGKPSSTASR